MPLCISIRFLTGRAHLHHWHAHHSDGKVDWPPSPWRLLRALVATAGTGLTSLPEPLDEAIADTESDALPVSRLAAVLATLSSPPRIWLPRTSGGHTRQFLPMKNKTSGSAVFDTFATVSKETPIVFEWPEVELPADDSRLADLQLLLRRLTYFGRAESWCDATLHSDLPVEVLPEKSHWCCTPHAPGEKITGREHVEFTIERKLAVEQEAGAEFRQQAEALLPSLDFKIFESKTNRAGKKTEKWIKPTPAKREAFKQLLSQETLGTLLLRCLLRSSGQDIGDGLERPVGSRWLHYCVPRAIYQVPPNKTRSAMPPRAEPVVTLMRFALNTATANRPVLPSIKDTLLVADKFRSAALAWHGHLYDKSNESRPRNLRGREDDNSIARNDHDHAYFWPTDDDGDGFIDHITVRCSSGLSRGEVEALRRLLRLKQRGGRPDLLVTPVYEGRIEEFPQWKGKTAAVFVSATPYFPNVHITNGANRSTRRLKLAKVVRHSLAQARITESPSQIHQIIAVGNVPPSVLPEVLQQCLPHSSLSYPERNLWDADTELPVGADFLQTPPNSKQVLRPLDFCRRRKDSINQSSGRYLQISFPTPIPAQAFALGYGSHFGLGLFVPVD
jgi:CRISPR-associated protein Csb2